MAWFAVFQPMTDMSCSSVAPLSARSTATALRRPCKVYLPFSALPKTSVSRAAMALVSRPLARRERVEAYERIPMDERRAYERGQRVRYDAWRYKDGSMPDIPGEYSWCELRAYRAGLAGEPIPGLEVRTNGAGETGIRARAHAIAPRGRPRARAA